MTRKRADSAHEQTKIMTAALRGIKPPAHLELREGDLPFWEAIINARSEWTDVDLAHAANLARCQADIEQNQKELDIEGSILKNERGTPVMNPRFTILEQLSRRSVAISSRIQVHAAATIGESKLGKGKNTAKRNSLHAMQEVEDDDLIARPKTYQ